MKIGKKSENISSVDVGNFPVWDKKSMSEHLLDDACLVREVAESFAADVPRRIRSLRGHIETGNINDAGRQAHTIKGAAANVSAERLRVTAFDLEKAARDGDIETAEALIGQLEAEFDLLKKEMEAGFHPPLTG